MDDILVQRVKKAQNSKEEAEKLLEDYMPFIKKNVIKNTHHVLDYDERLNIAMMAFLKSVESYNEERGNFLAYSAKVIYHQLIDEERKELNYSSKVLLYSNQVDEEDKVTYIQEEASVAKHYIQLEHNSLIEEIDTYSKELEKFQISFYDLAKLGPKREKSRNLCYNIASLIVKNEILKKDFYKQHRIPQAQLAKFFSISLKTVEKYRKYIVAVVILMDGDYPKIQTFINKEGTI